MAQPLIEGIYEEVLRQQSYILRTFMAVCKKANIPQDKFTVNWRKICEAAIRTLRREEFYKMYHTSIMSEIKLMAVLAFWILKYKPFCCKEINIGFVSENINEYIAINLIRLMVCETRQRHSNNHIIQITANGFKQLVYRLKNWDLSKESLMTLADFLYYYDGSKIDNLDTAESNYGRVGRI